MLHGSGVHGKFQSAFWRIRPLFSHILRCWAEWVCMCVGQKNMKKRTFLNRHWMLTWDDMAFQDFCWEQCIDGNSDTQLTGRITEISSAMLTIPIIPAPMLSHCQGSHPIKDSCWKNHELIKSNTKAFSSAGSELYTSPYSRPCLVSVFLFMW